MTNTRERFLIPKLFGGPVHGKRVVLDASLPAHTVPIMPPKKPFVSVYDLGQTYRDEVYLRRNAMFGNNREVIYYTHSSADDAKAFEMLTNYLLRGSVKL